MWSPTHVQVIVQKARGLNIKGKNGTNDAFVTIQLGKEKYQTSVKEKSGNPEWNEECELTIPDGNTSSIGLTVLHRNFVGMDKFLGHVQLPLNELDIYERSRSRWYTLQGKPGKSSKSRGELEVKISFTVKSVTGSLMDLSKKPKIKSNSLPLKMVHSVGGSLMNLASKEKKLGSQAVRNLTNYGHKLSDKLHNRRRKSSQTTINEHEPHTEPDEDGFSYRSGYDSGDEAGDSTEKLHTQSEQTPPSKPPRLTKEEEMQEWENKLRGITHGSGSTTSSEQSQSVPEVVEETLTESDFPSDTPTPLPASITKTKAEKANVRRHTVEVAATNLKSTDSQVTPKIESNSKKDWSGSSEKVAHPAAPSGVATTARRGSSATPLAATVLHSSPATTNELSNAQHVVPPSSVKRAPAPPVPAPLTRSALGTLSPSQGLDVKLMPHLVTGEQKLKVENSKLLSALPRDKLLLFEKMSKEELVELIICQQSAIDNHLKQVRELEDYIDDLLVRVMETTPRILQNPFRLSPSIRYM